jgi:multidrug efflux pump subunit AcrB
MAEPTPLHLAKPHGPVAWMVNNRVTPNLLMLVLLLGGLFLALQIKQEVFPDFEFDVVRVSVSYSGSSPEEVERGIILSIEEAVRGLEGVKEIESRASEGSGRVTIELMEDADHQLVYQNIKQEVDRITTFPEDAEEPSVSLLAHRRGVLRLQVFGNASEWALREVAEQARDRLLTNPEITQVDLVGARDYEIQVEVSQASLRAYDLTIEEIAKRIGTTAVEIPGGSVKTSGGEILLRVDESRDWAREFADIPIISTAGGSVLRLGDIATVREGFEESDRIATYNGHPNIGLEVYRVGEETPISISNATRRALAEIEPDLPEGIEIAINRDQSDVYRQRLQLLLKNACIGLGLVLILLGVFLETKLAFWVTMGIPISFLGSFLFLYPAGASINMISMFAFIVALGIVVDDAIIAGENIYECRQRGMDFKTAAIVGAREVMTPIAFAILSNVVAFMPLYFIPGVMGKVFSVIPLVVITAFIVSWVEAVFILPAHLAHSKPSTGIVGTAVRRGRRVIAGLLDRFIHGVYGPLLRKGVSYRYAVVAANLSILALVVAYSASGRIGFVLMPRAESNFAMATAVLPYGSPVSESKAVRDRLVEAAQKVADANGGEDMVRGISAMVEENEISIRAMLTAPDIRPLNTRQFTQAWRTEVGPITGLESLKYESDRGGPGSGAGLTVELSHREIDILDAAAVKLAEHMAEFPQLSDIDDGSSAGKEQISFKILPEGQSLGLTAYDVARQVRNAFYGAEALRQQRGRNEVTVKVRLPEAERGGEFDIERLLLRTPAGRDVPLMQVAEVWRGRAYTTINRRDGQRTVKVTANVQPIGETSRIRTTLGSDILPALAHNIPGLTYSFEGRQAEMRDSMQSLITSFLVALFAIYALLAIPFGSYIQPLIVMMAIPLGFVGAVLGHLLMGYNLSVMSMMGVVALSGVVINDALVMMDFANRRRREGIENAEAIIMAGIRRFRPIMLTTLTTFGGLAPMIFETSRQARFMIPMAISLGFGILFATLITLVFVPCLYLIADDVTALFQGKPRPELGGGEQPDIRETT